MMSSSVSRSRIDGMNSSEIPGCGASRPCVRLSASASWRARADAVRRTSGEMLPQESSHAHDRAAGADAGDKRVGREGEPPRAAPTISGPVVRSCASTLSSFANCAGETRRASRARALPLGRCEPRNPPSVATDEMHLGAEDVMSAMRSLDIQSGMKIATGCPARGRSRRMRCRYCRSSPR